MSGTRTHRSCSYARNPVERTTQCLACIIFWRNEPKEGGDDVTSASLTPRDLDKVGWTGTESRPDRMRSTECKYMWSLEVEGRQSLHCKPPQIELRMCRWGKPSRKVGEFAYMGYGNVPEPSLDRQEDGALDTCIPDGGWKRTMLLGYRTSFPASGMPANHLLFGNFRLQPYVPHFRTFQQDMEPSCLYIQVKWTIISRINVAT